LLLTLGSSHAVGGGVHAGKSAIVVTAVTVDDIAVVAILAKVLDPIGTIRGDANPTLAVGIGAARGVVRQRCPGTAGVVGVVANALSFAWVGRRACARIRRFTAERTIVATIPIGDVAVVTILAVRHELIAAHVVTADAALADQHVATAGAVGRRCARVAGMFLGAGLDAVAKIGVVTRGVTVDGALGTSPGAVVLATVARNVVAVVALFLFANDAVDHAIELVTAAGAALQSTSDAPPSARLSACGHRAIAATTNERHDDKPSRPTNPLQGSTIKHAHLRGA